MKQLVLFIALVSLLVSCEDPIEIDHPDGGIRYSLEGEITTKKDKHRVLITSSTVFDAEEIPTISGAKVTLHSSDGVIFNYEDAGNGVYYTLDSTQGEIGKTYYIRAELPDGTVLQSYPELLKSVTPIDSIYAIHVSEYRYLEGPPREIDDSDTGYFVFINVQEAPGKGDAYRWRVTINGNQQNFLDESFFAKDEYVDGNYVDQWDLNFLAFNGQIVQIDQLSISQSNYKYLFSLYTESQPAGGFGTPPAPVIGNMYDTSDKDKIVFGYFSASDIQSATLTISGTKK